MDSNCLIVNSVAYVIRLKKTWKHIIHQSITDSNCLIENNVAYVSNMNPLWKAWICIFKSSSVWKHTPHYSKSNSLKPVWILYGLVKYVLSSLLQSDNIPTIFTIKQFESIMDWLHMCFQIFFSLKTYATLFTNNQFIMDSDCLIVNIVV